MYKDNSSTYGKNILDNMASRLGRLLLENRLVNISKVESEEVQQLQLFMTVKAVKQNT